MVDTQDLANAVAPYQSDKDRFDEEESLEIVDDLFRRYGFAQTDSLVYHGGPSEEEDDARFELLEEVTHLLYSNGNSDVDLYVPEDQLYRAENSDRIHEDKVKTFNPEDTRDDIEMSVGEGHDGKTVAVTSDYHMERVDSLYREITEGEHLVLGADSSDHRIASREIPFVGQSVPATQTLAELNEIKNLWT